MSRSRGERGVTLVELLVGLVIGVTVVHLAMRAVGTVHSAHRTTLGRVDRLTALRTAQLVLRREIRYGRAGRDWTVAPDSLALRAFRGTGLVCPAGVRGDTVIAWYRGDRHPDVRKDSVLVLDMTGRIAVAALTGVAPAGPPCHDGAPPGGVVALVLDRAVAPRSVFVRVFESGSYHLSGSALRYRRGRSGRQPLTQEVWATPASRWTERGGWVVTRYVGHPRADTVELYLAATNPSGGR